MAKQPEDLISPDLKQAIVEAVAATTRPRPQGRVLVVRCRRSPYPPPRERNRCRPPPPRWRAAPAVEGPPTGHPHRANQPAPRSRRPQREVCARPRALRTTGSSGVEASIKSELGVALPIACL